MISELDLNETVDMPGFKSNPYAYMAASAAFVLSSAHEGLPTVLVEALTCGCHVVATDCPSGPHEILHGGALGPLVPVGDPERMAKAIIEVLDDRIPKPTAEAWQPYTVESVVAKYLSVLLPQQPNLATG